MSDPKFQINDPINIIGLASLMKNDMDIDADQIEKEVINGNTLQETTEDDITAQYIEEIEKLNNKLNLNIADSGMSNLDMPDKDNAYQDFYDTSNTQTKDNLYGRSNEQHNTQPRTANNYTNYTNSIYDNINDVQLKSMTIEEQNQTHVNKVLEDIEIDENLEFDIDKEKEEDDKNALLEQIDGLRESLLDDGINLSTVPIVTNSSSLSDISNVYKVLQLKNNRNRYCSFAEELILAGAYGLEYLFDGKNEWLGRKPDLVGWSSTVRIKLRRCRFQTSTLVKDMMQSYNMGPGFQLFLELIPSLFLYSRAKKLSNNSSADDAKYEEALSNLNSM